MAPRLWLLVLGLAGLLLALFFALEPVLPGELAAPSGWLDRRTAPVALAAVALLASDVVLPVPSSLVMIADGAVFGLALGAVVSTVGALLSAVIGYVLGRSAEGRTRRWLGEGTSARLALLLERHGFAVVVATRPIPLLAEVAALLAGGGRMPVGSFLAASLLGVGVTSLVYAAAGAGAVGGSVGGSVGWLALAAALTVAGGSWWYGRRALHA